MKEKFSVVTSTCVPLPMENVDTDQIIPARFLKVTSREGFGENLFRDWRFDKDGNPVKDFVLNNPVYSGQVLVAGKNFGCGSSREHAAWAIHDYGFRVVVSSFFADIHRNNELNSFVEDDPKTSVRVDLEAQTITNLATGDQESFDINPYKKQCLAQGLDDIEYLLTRRDDTAAFESANGK